MPPWVAPCINRCGPCAVRFNGNVIDTTNDADKAILTVVSTPRVTNGPVLCAILNSVADNGNVVNNVHITSCVLINASSITLKRVRYSDTACNGSTLVDFLHHGFFTRYWTKLINIVNSVLIWDETRATTRLAVFTNVDGCTDDTIV